MAEDWLVSEVDEGFWFSQGHWSEAGSEASNKDKSFHLEIGISSLRKFI